MRKSSARFDGWMFVWACVCASEFVRVRPTLLRHALTCSLYTLNHLVTAEDRYKKALADYQKKKEEALKYGRCVTCMDVSMRPCLLLSSSSIIKTHTHACIRPRSPLYHQGAYTNTNIQSHGAHSKEPVAPKKSPLLRGLHDIVLSDGGPASKDPEQIRHILCPVCVCMCV